jgi:predicted phage terminase large subunit-like protein
MLTKEQIRNELRKELARRSYADYVEYVHEGRWIKSKHLLFTCNKIQEFIETNTGHAFDILILQLPPQHGKSMSTTETLPSWYLGKYPENRVIQASYNEETAERFCRRNKEKIKQFGKALFNIEISNVDRSTEFELTNNVGRMISRGIMSGITSNPANLIIIDDPIKNRLEADSETFRERLWEEWQNTIKTRLSANAKVIVIMTRWHEDDLAGRILLNEKNVTTINLPCEAEDNDPLGRTKGQALFPEIGKDDKWLQEFKQGYMSIEGSRAWLALFQGRPTNEEGNIVKRHWFKYYNELPKMILTTISVDATFKDGENNDFVSIQVWGKRDKDYYLIDRYKERMDFPTTLQAIKNIRTKYNTHSTLIEDKANGSAIISMLQREISGIIPVKPDGGKEARLNAVTPVMESGNVYLPNAEWINDYVDELCKFPNAAHDDDVDSTSQALNYLRYKNADIKELTPEEEERLAREKQRLQRYTSGAMTNSFFKYNG